jgi:hypothetical protein
VVIPDSLIELALQTEHVATAVVRRGETRRQVLDSAELTEGVIESMEIQVSSSQIVVGERVSRFHCDRPAVQLQGSYRVTLVEINCPKLFRTSADGSSETTSPQSDSESRQN